MKQLSKPASQQLGRVAAWYLSIGGRSLSSIHKGFKKHSKARFIREQTVFLAKNSKVGSCGVGRFFPLDLGIASDKLHLAEE